MLAVARAHSYKSQLVRWQTVLNHHRHFVQDASTPSTTVQWRPAAFEGGKTDTKTPHNVAHQQAIAFDEKTQRESGWDLSPRGKSLGDSGVAWNPLHQAAPTEEETDVEAAYEQGLDAEANNAWWAVNEAHNDPVAAVKDTKTTSVNAGDSGQLMERLVHLLTQARSPEQILNFMRRVCTDLDFMRLIPTTTFIELLRQLGPQEDVVMALQDGHKMLGHYGVLKEDKLRAIYGTFARQREVHQTIVQNRLRSSHDLSLAEYTHMLNFSRGTYDGIQAWETFRDMKSRGIEPDVPCYNHFFEAVCWADMIVLEKRMRLRNIHIFQDSRRREHRYTQYHDVLRGDGVLKRWKLRDTVVQGFADMVRSGLEPDVRSYTHFITAHARVGDVEGIERILLQVWGVDVVKLRQGQTEPNVELRMKRESAAYPDEGLLMAVAHAFGANNDALAATLVVQHIASTYEISVPVKVWEELLEWVYTLTRTKNVHWGRLGHTPGQLPMKTVDSLWDVIVSTKVEPTMRMLDLMARHHIYAQRWLRTMAIVRQGVDLHNKLYGNGGPQDSLRNAEASFDQTIQHPYERRERLMQYVSFRTIRAWLREILRGRRWLMIANPVGNQVENRVVRERRVLPDTIMELERFRGHEEMVYDTLGGRVEMRDHSSWSPSDDFWLQDALD